MANPIEQRSPSLVTATVASPLDTLMQRVEAALAANNPQGKALLTTLLDLVEQNLQNGVELSEPQRDRLLSILEGAHSASFARPFPLLTLRIYKMALDLFLNLADTDQDDEQNLRIANRLLLVFSLCPTFSLEAISTGADIALCRRLAQHILVSIDNPSLRGTIVLRLLNSIPQERITPDDRERKFYIVPGRKGQKDLHALV